MINSAHIDIKNSEKSYNSLLEKIGLEKRDLAIKEIIKWMKAYGKAFIN